MCVVLALPWLGKNHTIAVAYCVPAKSPAIGILLSIALFTGLSPHTKVQIQIPLVIFQGLQVVAGSLMTLVFRRWIRPDEERADDERKMGITKEKHAKENISARDSGEEISDSSSSITDSGEDFSDPSKA